MNLKLSILFSLLICSLYTFAGVKIISKSQSYDCKVNSKEYDMVTMYLRKDIMRMDMTNSSTGVRTGFIYKSSDKKMWILDHKDKSYFSISEADFKKVEQQLSQMQQMMEEQLKNVPEEQRASMRQAMGQHSGLQALEGPVKEQHKTGISESINGWDCDKYECTEDGEKTEIIWVTPFDNLNVSLDDLHILEDFSEFISGSFKMFALGNSTSFIAPDQDIKGLPVRTINIIDGKECGISNIESISEETMEDIMFQIPKDYRREENPMKGK